MFSDSAMYMPNYLQYIQSLNSSYVVFLNVKLYETCWEVFVVRNNLTNTLYNITD